MQKACNQIGISPSLYMIGCGIGVILLGIVLYIINPRLALSTQSGILAVLIGTFWALGMTLVAVAINAYRVPVSKLAPLYNMNTLVTVVLGLIIFTEFKDVNVAKLLTGAVLITLGGILVANA
jgi:drug/metabolite transporter (DMT)-like permease